MLTKKPRLRHLTKKLLFILVRENISEISNILLAEVCSRCSHIALFYNLKCPAAPSAAVFLFEESFEWISVESRNYFPPGLFTTADLTGDRRLPYGFFFLQNDSSCLFPTNGGSLRMSPSPTGCGTTSPTGSHTGDRTSTAPGVPLACAAPKLFPNHFFTGNVPHLRLERRCSHLEIAHSLPVKDV